LLSPNRTLEELKLEPLTPSASPRLTPNRTLEELKLMRKALKKYNDDSPNRTLEELKLDDKAGCIIAIGSQSHLRGIETERAGMSRYQLANSQSHLRGIETCAIISA